MRRWFPINTKVSLIRSILKPPYGRPPRNFATFQPMARCPNAYIGRAEMNESSQYSRHIETDEPAAASPQGAYNHNKLAAIAFERTRMPMVVSDPRQKDSPIVLANKAFLDLTGYTPEEVIGRNCRFLQGPGTSKTAVAEIRAALQEEREASVE